MGLQRFIVNQRKFCWTKVACADIDVVAQYEGQHHCSFSWKTVASWEFTLYLPPIFHPTPKKGASKKKKEMKERNAIKVVHYQLY